MPLVRHIADGVLASGLQQTFDCPPWVGLYPDVWDTQQNIAHGAFICAMLPTRCLQAQGRIPDATLPWTRVMIATPARQPWHVSGWGKPISMDPPVKGGAWTVKVSFIEDQPNELVVARAPKPRAVLRGTEVLAEVDDPARSGSGWRYDEELQTLLVRFVHESRVETLRVDW
jgi:hypothetical protein